MFRTFTGLSDVIIVYLLSISDLLHCGSRLYGCFFFRLKWAIRNTSQMRDQYFQLGFERFIQPQQLVSLESRRRASDNVLVTLLSVWPIPDKSRFMAFATAIFNFIFQKNSNF